MAVSTTNRDPQEVVDVFKYNMDMLEHLCKEFDNGRIESALWMAVILRTLLHTHVKPNGDYSSYGILDQLKAIDLKYNVDFLSTAFPRPSASAFMQGWSIGDHVCGINISASSVYTGLLINVVNCKEGGGYVADIKAKAGEQSHVNKNLPFSQWWNEIVFSDAVANQQMSRWNVIQMVANKDGGAHFDPDVPVQYDTFRHPDLFEVRFGATKVPFSKNPVYVSVRQIAWEVVESLKDLKEVK